MRVVLALSALSAIARADASTGGGEALLRVELTTAPNRDVPEAVEATATAFVLAGEGKTLWRRPPLPSLAHFFAGKTAVESYRPDPRARRRMPPPGALPPAGREGARPPRHIPVVVPPPR